MTRYAITDIHGCKKSFLALLDQIGFSKSDTLFLLGDYIHRGPDSIGVIEHILSLQKQGYNIFCLMGNHEEMAIAELQHFLEHADAPIRPSTDTLVKDLFATYGEIPKHIMQFMDGLSHVFYLKDYLLVHAGFNFNTPNPFGDKYSMVWIRNWYDSIDYELVGNRIIIHGHTPINQILMLEQHANMEQRKYLDIDGGCVFSSSTWPIDGFGYLCALNLDTRQLTQQLCID